MGNDWRKSFVIENIGERLKKILEGKFYMLKEIFIICFYGIENLKIGEGSFFEKIFFCQT